MFSSSASRPGRHTAPCRLAQTLGITKSTEYLAARNAKTPAVIFTDMLAKQQAIPLLLEACPSFEAEYEAHCAECGNDLPYVAAGDFARHLLALHQSGQLEALSNAARAIERLHTEGDAWVREFATVGVLEAVQNAWSHSTVDPEEFVCYLGPASKRWWQGLNNFWSGNAPLVKPPNASDA